jgi:hypothetical protein
MGDQQKKRRGASSTGAGDLSLRNKKGAQCQLVKRSFYAAMVLFLVGGAALLFSHVG